MDEAGRRWREKVRKTVYKGAGKGGRWREKEAKRHKGMRRKGEGEKGKKQGKELDWLA